MIKRVVLCDICNRRKWIDSGLRRRKQHLMNVASVVANGILSLIPALLLHTTCIIMISFCGDNVEIRNENYFR